MYMFSNIHKNLPASDTRNALHKIESSILSLILEISLNAILLPVQHIRTHEQHTLLALYLAQR